MHCLNMSSEVIGAGEFRRALDTLEGFLGGVGVVDGGVVTKEGQVCEG